MKEEDTLLKKIGKEPSFKVPEGYFENLTSEVMNKLPEKEKRAFKEVEPTKWMRMKPFVYLAAMFVGAALIIRVASSDNQPIADKADGASQDKEIVSDQLIDAAVDAIMMDDYSLYVYLNDANAE